MEEDIKSVNRETLYEEIWTDPVVVVAARYGLSDVGLAKICRALAIPLPSRGYWAKVKAGRIMGRAPLPKLAQDDRRTMRLVKLPPEQAAIRTAAKRSSTQIREEISCLPIDDVPSSPLHPLVDAASVRLRRRDGWPDTPERSAPKEVLHLSVAPASLERALTFLDKLLNVLTMQGFDFEIDTTRGVSLLRKVETRTTLEFSLTEQIQRTRHIATPAEERARKKYWERSHLDRSVNFPDIPAHDYTPTGILTLRVGRWPSKSWKDTPKKNLEGRLGEVIAGIVVLAVETNAKEQEDARREEVRRQAVARHEFLVKRRADEVKRFQSLEQSANDWERAAKLRAFADAVEINTKEAGLPTMEQLDWLAWVRAKADWLDPLIRVSDPILDAPEPRAPGYYGYGSEGACAAKTI